MKRVVPKAHKVELEFISGFTLTDLFVGLLGFIIIVMIFVSSISFKVYLCLFFALLEVILLTKIDNERGYVTLYYIVKFLIFPKVYLRNDSKDNKDNKDSKDNKKESKKLTKKNIGFIGKKNGAISEFFSVSMISEDGFITYTDGSIGFALRILPIFFEFLTENEKNSYINNVYAKVFRLLNLEQSMQVVKVDLQKEYDQYIINETDKGEALLKAYEYDTLSEDEYVTRAYVNEERLKYLKSREKNSKVYESAFYLLVYGRRIEVLKELKENILTIFTESKMEVRSLDLYETAEFLKASYTPKFDKGELYRCKSQEEVLKWLAPTRVDIMPRECIIDGTYQYCYRLSELPTFVTSAWANELCNIENTKVVFNVFPIETSKAIRQIDNSIDELRERKLHSIRASKSIDTELQYSALVSVLKHLQTSSEAFFGVNVYLVAYDELKSKIKKMPIYMQQGNKFFSTLRKDTRFKIKELGYNIDDGFMRQKQQLLGSLISQNDGFKKKAIGMYGELIGASFPFISQVVSDVGGVNLGTISKQPALFNFFKRDAKHVNSNMIVIGKSGSGKSYFTKVLISNLAADNCKIFILDPENEYADIVENYHGKRINLANSNYGLINPFQITQVLEDEDEKFKQGFEQSLGMHLQFLESFFSLLLDGISNDAFEVLNNLVKRLYDSPKFKNCEDISSLKPEDFPTFDDLYKLIQEEKQHTNADYYRNNLDIVSNYIEKFSSGGRNSNLWNGFSKIETSENLIQFNYQQLLANDNSVISNAQMLLVIHWLNNEIINNRNYNLQYNTNRKIIVIIDEAHVFIDEKHPIALDFMHNLAKRIRKYNGMQVVITQNIKDFVGSEELSRKSTAIINASQYSFIFSLSPNDINDLCDLYKNAGGISIGEREQILNIERGTVFFISSPAERGILKVEVPSEISEVFSAE